MTRSDSKLTQCVFCSIVDGKRTPQTVAYRDDKTVVFPSLHQRPQNRGHMLVIPTSHIPYIYDLDASLGSALMATVSAVARAVKAIWSADGVVVRQNNEPHGDQDVFHVHFHVIPRFANDGFNRGEDRHPFGVEVVPEHERIGQAERTRAFLHNEVKLRRDDSSV